MTRWVDARKVDEKRLLESQVAIPEPVHRVSALSSGISLRSVRRNGVNKLREVCEAYEAKCAGKYESNSLATRYVFNLSREVQAVLADIVSTCRGKDDRIRSLERTLQEWEENFGPVHWMEPAVIDELKERSNYITVLDKTQRTTRTINDNGELQAVPVVSPARLKNLIDDLSNRVLALRATVEGQKSERVKLERALRQEAQAQLMVLRGQCNLQLQHAQTQAEELARKTQENCHKEIDKMIATAIEEDRANSALRRPIKTEEALRRAVEAERSLEILNEEVKRLRNQAARAFEKERLRARASIAAEEATRRRLLEQQVADAHRRVEEEKEERARSLAKLEQQVVVPLREQLANSAKLSTDIKLENDYLKGRVKELNRLLAAFQSAVS